VQTPGAQFYSTLGSQSHKPVAHNQPQYADYLSSAGVQSTSPPAPAGGYSQYTYNPAGQPHHGSVSAGGGYDIHSQVYRPTEAEHAHVHRRQSKVSASAGSGEPKSKWEQRQEKTEKGVSKLFKKIEKKIG
jgi:hypothetical protein